MECGPKNTLRSQKYADRFPEQRQLIHDIFGFSDFQGVEGDHDGNAKRSKNENVNNKADEEAKGGCNDENEKQKANQKPPKQPKDYIHVIPEKISERIKLLQDIVPGCNKGMEALTEVKVSIRSLAMVIMVESLVKEFHKVLVVRNDLKMGKGKIAAQCRGVSLSIRRLKEIQCYRGVIHIKGLPCKGQRAKNNSRTLKGKRVAIPGK
ncbi:hypothetical protein BUALT_Bualt10G0079200 [Buddleja alternifolia]|uniref:Uncharacterized protein n=1 Tax=Buddleja alternifolia TaxID=168488 RepID=A0AAV6X7R9_9LAMI|nr:hypothetical protein BUALT_Bualt10G0079200 [Buddleja alternifolia]